MTPSILAIGEALVEIMRPDVGMPLDRPGEFRGPFASGAPAIFAVAAARLGFSTGLISAVGQDAFGRLLLDRLSAEGVDTATVQVLPGYTTGMAFIAYREDGAREFVFHLRQSAAAAMEAASISDALFQNLGWLHLSGSALALSESGRAACSRAVESALVAGARLSFDPNLRPELMPLAEARQVYKPYMDAAALMLPTVEEALALTGAAGEDEAADQLLGHKDRLVVFKRGAAGCTIFSPKGRLDVPGIPVEEVDPTGAGDCFNAAFIFALEQAWPLEKAARFANAAGALAVTKLGPMEGAPTPTQIHNILQSQ